LSFVFATKEIVDPRFTEPEINVLSDLTDSQFPNFKFKNSFLKTKKVIFWSHCELDRLQIWRWRPVR